MLSSYKSPKLYEETTKLNAKHPQNVKTPSNLSSDYIPHSHCSRNGNIAFLGKPVIGFQKPVLNRLSVLLTFIKT